jgi:DME family drug/metabolite transporter
MRRRPSFEVLAGVGLAVGGVFLVSGAVSESVGSTDAIGIAAGLASAILFASSTLVGDRVIGTFGPAGGLLRGCLVASGLWICWQMTQGWPETLFDPSNLPRVVYVGLLATAAPFLLYFWGVQRVKVERAAIVATLEPVLAAVVAWTWLGQTLTFMQMLGGALVIAAILLIQTREHEPVLAPDV